MKRSIRTATAIVATVGAMLAATGAQALTRAFTITSVDYNVSGLIEIDTSSPSTNGFPCATCATGPAYLVTGISGDLNGREIVGLRMPDTFRGNTNTVYLDAPYLDFGGIGFETAGMRYKVFQGDYAGKTGYFLSNWDTPGAYAFPVSFTLSAPSVPEPATWAMMIGGFGLAGTALRRRAAMRYRTA